MGNYRVVLKRINTGAKLCEEFVRLVHERAAIEKQYAKQLTSWGERWQGRVKSNGEYGSLKDGWLSMFTEARELADIHIGIKDRLEQELTSEVETWKKQNYERSIIHWKSFKRAQSAFEKAQAPWTKRKEKILKYKKAIESHSAQAETLRRRVQAGVGTDKTKAQMDKEDFEVAKYKAKLKQRADEMIIYHDVYRHNMLAQFEICQAEERVRIEFFKSALLSYHAKTDFLRNYESVHQSMLAGMQRVNASADLDRFSKEHGAEMPFVLPDEHGNFHLVHDINELKTKTTASVPAPAAAVTVSYQPAPAAAAAAAVAQPSPATHFQVGTRLHALYDYTATKPDELSFAFDDVLVVTAPPGQVEKGWIKARHETNGTEGIVPENYVELEEI